MQGWIKLHRKLIDNPIFLKEGLLQLFIYCLLKANHEPNKIIFNGKEMLIEAGQFITGREVLSKELKQNGRTLYDRLKVLSNLQILSIKSNNKFSLVTIVNYSLYQFEEQKPNSKTNNQPTTSQQPANTNKNDKNVKNDKKIKDIYISVQHLSITKEEYEKLVSTYGEVKVKDKIEYAENYSKLKNYNSLYLTLNNWLKADVCKVIDHPYRKMNSDSSGNVFFDILKEKGKL